MNCCVAVAINDVSHHLLLVLLLLLQNEFVPSEGQSNGDLRLNNDGSLLMSNISEGRLEVYLNSEWGTVCDDNFRHAEATVACRQLGFAHALNFGVTGRLGFKDGKDEVLIYLDQVNCTGKEDAVHLLSCVDGDSHMSHDCSHTEDVALICNRTLLSDADPFDGQIRLTGGTYPSLGLVEVYCNGQWGTVCDDLFSYVEASTVCAQLGYNRAVNFDHLNLFGNESQSIWLDNVNCGNGHQCLTSCQTCPKEEFHNCGHHEDVTIECSYEFYLSNAVQGFSTVGINTCEIHNSDSKINGEIIAVILVSVVFVVLCFALCIVCIAFVVCWKRKLKSSISDDDSMSNATEMTRSTTSTQPIPPPRPTDLPPLGTPSSAFSQTFSPFSPFIAQSQPLLPPRPQNLLPTPTNPINPGLFSPFSMPPSQGIYESTPVYIAPDKTGRYIYIDPSDTKQELPPLPSGINYYERTPTGAGYVIPEEGLDSADHYESIPPLVSNTYTDCKFVLDRSPARKKATNTEERKPNVETDEEDYEKLCSANQEDVAKENCYDNLEPSQDATVTEISKVDLAAKCSIDEDSQSVTKEDSTSISIAPLEHQTTTDKTEPEVNVSYVNVKEVQAEVSTAEESSSYDILRPAEMTDKSAQSTDEQEKKASAKLYCNVDEVMDSSSTS